MKYEPSPSTKKERYSINNQAGYSLLEVILASAIFVLLVTALVGAFLYGQESTALAGHRARAVMLAEEGLEATRNIRDDSFINLTDGTHGLTIVGNQWTLAGTEDTVDIFTRQVAISAIDADRKLITSSVSWQQNLQRTGLVSLTTRLVNWAGISIGANQADNLVVNPAGAFLAAGNREMRGLTLENIGPTNITIDKITVSWTDPIRSIEQIIIDGIRVWDQRGPGTPLGVQPSGTELDIQDFVLTSGSGVLNIDKIRFDGAMIGNIFTIIFTMGDSSLKTVTGITL